MSFFQSASQSTVRSSLSVSCSSSRASRKSSPLNNDVNTPLGDPREPPCVLSLYIRPIHRGIRDDAEHWVLCFDWGYYTCWHEGNNVNGVLKHCWGEGKPNLMKGEECEIIIIKKKLHVLPHTVEQKAQTNVWNGKTYNVLTSNCQDWAKSLASSFGLKLPISQTDIALAIPGSRELVTGISVSSQASSNHNGDVNYESYCQRSGK